MQLSKYLRSRRTTNTLSKLSSQRSKLLLSSWWLTTAKEIKNLYAIYFSERKRSLRDLMTLLIQRREKVKSMKTQVICPGPKVKFTSLLYTQSKKKFLSFTWRKRTRTKWKTSNCFSTFLRCSRQTTIKRQSRSTTFTECLTGQKWKRSKICQTLIWISSSWETTKTRYWTTWVNSKLRARSPTLISSSGRTRTSIAL